MRKTSPFVKLTSAAMALPAFADTQPVESTLSVKLSQYSEDDASTHRIIAGDDDRYDIDVGQFRLITPLGKDWSLGIDTSREIMSGASPWYTLAGLSEESSLVMSGATIQDARTEATISVTHYRENRSISLGLTRSSEDDYESRAVSVSGEWDFNNRLSTLALGFSYSSDEIEPSDALLFGRVQKEDKRIRSTSIGWTQVLDKNTAIYAGLGITKHDGYLSDPYKLLDTRPDDRLEWALSLRYRRYFDNRNAALHLDYRYFDDDWGVSAHTAYAAWYKNLPAGFQLAPNIRVYSQSEAEFYTVLTDFSLPPGQAQSSDYRLSGFGAYTIGVKGIYHSLSWSLSIDIDRYISSRSYGHSPSSESHPAELRFTLFSIGFDYRF